MSRESRERREARRRATARPARRAPSTGPSAAITPDDVARLVDLASAVAATVPKAAGPHLARLAEISSSATDGDVDPADLVVDEVLRRLASAWEQGWQPIDLVHATRRRTSKAVSQWMTGAVLAEASLSGAEQRAPRAWVDQLHALSSRHRDRVDRASLLPARGRADASNWSAALVALDLVRRLPGSQLLMPPPSRWDAVRSRRDPGPTAIPLHTQLQGEKRAKMLTKVRSLLAKAESTDFVAEADALTAKAQHLMTTYSIDESLLHVDDDHIDVHGIRVPISHPYAVEKAGLLGVIATSNRVRTVWSDFASCATLVGVPVDTEQVEMLFTSTLVQATRAMTQAGETSIGNDRSSSFRKAFLTAYAHRIGQRLTASADEAAAAYGSALVPVLQRQAEAVDDELARLFPRMTTTSRRKSFDARGWDAGTRAADAAVLPAGVVES